MKRYFIFPRAPGLEPHPQIIQCHTRDTRWGGGTPLQRFSRYMLYFVRLSYIFIVILSSSRNFLSILIFSFQSSDLVAVVNVGHGLLSVGEPIGLFVVFLIPCQP